MRNAPAEGRAISASQVGLLLALLCGACASAPRSDAGSSPERSSEIDRVAGPPLDEPAPASAAEAPVLVAAVPAIERPDSRTADPKNAGPWELTLAGSGSNDKKFNTGGAVVDGSVGYNFNEVLELVGRQTVAFAEPSGGPSSWDFSSRVALDAHLPLGPIRPFGGVTVGYQYGQSTKEAMTAGPEAGLKIHLKDDIFVFGMAEYRAAFSNSDAIDDGFRNGVFVYGIGLGVRL